jgi:hypothetical protein
VRELFVEGDRLLNRVRYQDRRVFVESSPRKKARNRTAQAIISRTPRASMPTPITKTPPIGPKAVKTYSQMEER